MNIYEHIKTINSNNGSKPAIFIRLDDGSVRSYTYEQLFYLADVFADALTNIGIKPGDRVAIVAENCPEYGAAYLAIAKLKATAVLLDASLEQLELQKLIEKSRASSILTTPKSLEKLGSFADIPKLNILNNAGFFDESDSKTCAVKTTDGDENVSTILFSSGTTKTASGIMHSHDALLNTTQMTIECNNLDENDRFLAVLPNNHIYGLICQLIGSLSLGATLCYLESLSADALNSAFQEFRPTILPGVPKMYELLKTQIMRKINADPKSSKLFAAFFPKCLAIRKKTGVNIGKKLFGAIHKGFGSEIKVLCSAGAPLDAETAEFFYGTGFNIEITYGATETNIPTIGNYGRKLTTDTCGRAYPNVNISFADDGEILIKSPHMMLGYFDDEAATQSAFNEDGWFKTGDLGCVDEKGNIKIMGRSKDNIVLATGKKVAPDDIENAYSGISGVKELVICGVPVLDKSYDEAHAFVVTDSPDTAALLERFKQKSAGLSHSMKLADIHFVNEIPKTALQKPKRYLLKQMAELKKPESTTTAAQPAKVDTGSIVRDAVARVAGVNPDEILPNTKLFTELAIDSLGSIELCCEIEEKCGTDTDIAFHLHKGMTFSELVEHMSAPVESVKHSLPNQYPLKKKRHHYNIFRFTQNALHGLYNIKIENENVLPDNSGYIICSNHVSNFDYLFLTLNFKWERFSTFCCMAKKELFVKSFQSKLITKIAGMVPVDRGGFANDSFAAVRDKLKERWGLLIYPEGTRSATGELTAFKKGAALLSIEAGVPIVPAYIGGGYEVYPRSQKLPKLFNWKRMKKYRVDVKYGEPIFPKGLSAGELTEAVEMAVSRLKNNAVLVAK